MDLGDMTISQARAGLHNGEFSCLEYAESVGAQIKSTHQLNAITWADEDALVKQAAAIDANGAARGLDMPLGGIPLVLKDNIDTVGLPTTAGTMALRGYVPRCNAPVAQAVFDAGALLAGKGNMHELAFGVTCNNAVTGAVGNPWNPLLIPGGSSGGSAAAVAARIVPAALGTDTGASVRLPAALCGVVGFRPTVGRYSGSGVVPISSTRDTVGPIARSVEDVMLLDRVITRGQGYQKLANLSGIRLGVPRRYCYEGADPDVLSVIETSLRLLAGAGVQLVEAEIPSLAELNAAIGFPVALYEFARDVPEYLRSNGYDLRLEDIAAKIGSPDVAAIVQALMGSQKVPQAAYEKALDARLQLQAAYRDYFKVHRLDAIVFPTAVLPAYPIGDDETVELNGERVSTFATYIRNTDPGSNAGIPGISLPAGLTRGGLPVGLELDGAAGSDLQLLALAWAIERVLPAMSRPPAL